MVDPIPALFGGRGARELFAGGEFVACHGERSRLPPFLREGLLQGAGNLCRNFTGSVQIANGDAARGAQVALGRSAAATLLDLGLTVAFDALEQHLDGAAPWLRGLEAALGVPAESVRLMGFANAPGSGLSLHHDVHDQLLIHLQGQKTFLWQPNRYLSSPSDRFAHGSRPMKAFGADYQDGFPASPDDVMAAGMASVVLQPGSALFVPGGLWHATAGQTEQTMSVAVIVEAPSRAEVLLNWLGWHLRQSPEGRARAYGGWSTEPSAAVEGLRALTDALTERMPDPALAFAAWSLDRSFARPAHFPAGAPFERFIRLPFAEVMMRPTDDGGGLLVRVVCGTGVSIQADTTLSTMHESREVISWILGCHRAFGVDELEAACPAIDAAELRTLLAALGQAQLIRPLPTPPWAGR
jgi:hypothetical protein